MQLLRHRVAAPLDRFIECMWWSTRDAPQAHFEHMLPSGGTQLLVALHETPLLCRPSSAASPILWSGGIVHGPQSSFYLAGPKPVGSVVGVSFRPGAAAAMLGVALPEIADRHVTLAALWGRRGVDLHQRLMSAGEPARLFALLEQELSTRIDRRRLMHPLIAQALAARGPDCSPARVTDIQRASGYSPRHFIARFRAAVGLKPKHYFRIRRFNAAVRRMAAGNGGGLGDVAAACGYADQAHLCREFREMAGVTPAAYRPADATRPLHHRAAIEPFSDRR